ncbi:MAG: DUF4386 domain-containing protein [Chthoniobacterales bacterium]|nr:MAG: DUF4386 domain-containing protein [Chthoniobacterales bacterium]
MLLLNKKKKHMTRTTNARIAGFTYLAYIAIGIAGMVLFNQATSAEGIAAKLAGIAQHTTNVGATIVLTLLTCFAALVLGVTLYRITREQDPDLAMLALTCRVGEGVLSGIFVLATLGLLWLGTAVGENAPNTQSVHALAAFLFKAQGWNTLIGATFFAVGSMLFSWLLLRGRMIPVALAWLGVVASVLLVVGLPLQLAEFLHGAVTQLMWIPMAAFELIVALWLLIKGVPQMTTLAGD